MVALGRQAVPEAEWFLLDAFVESLPAVSVQVSSGLLQWADNPVEVLGRWKRGLKPGGRMVHAVACEPCLAEWRALVPETPLRWRDEAAWRAIFTSAGLRVIRAKLWVEEHYFASALELARCLHHSGVTGRARLGAGRLRAALRRYDGLHQREGKVVSTWAWLALEALPV
jgi:SAM-dependent methyltransferase